MYHLLLSSGSACGDPLVACGVTPNICFYGGDDFSGNIMLFRFKYVSFQKGFYIDLFINSRIRWIHIIIQIYSEKYFL